MVIFFKKTSKKMLRLLYEMDLILNHLIYQMSMIIHIFLELFNCLELLLMCLHFHIVAWIILNAVPIFVFDLLFRFDEFGPFSIWWLLFLLLIRLMEYIMEIVDLLFEDLNIDKFIDLVLKLMLQFFIEIFEQISILFVELVVLVGINYNGLYGLQLQVKSDKNCLNY